MTKTPILKTVLLAASLALVAGGVRAADYGAMNPKALQAAAVAAVDGNDESALMVIMKEMQKRQMLFFAKADDPACHREPPKVGVLANLITWGQARMAYATFLKKLALDSGNCGCITAQMTFEDFLGKAYGTTVADLSKDQVRKMSRYYNSQEGTKIEQDYHRFYTQSCTGE